MLPNAVQIVVFWIVQLSALLVFFVSPFRWPLVALWAASHFLRAIGLTLIFHRYLAHRAFKMNSFRPRACKLPPNPRSRLCANVLSACRRR